MTAPHIVLDESFAERDFPTHKLSSEQIITIVEDILRKPPRIRADYAVAKHNDFVLLHPRLFRSVTSAEDDFDVDYLRRMLKLIDSNPQNLEKVGQDVEAELRHKYNVKLPAHNP